MPLEKGPRWTEIMLLAPPHQRRGEPHEGSPRETGQGQETVEAERSVGAVLAVVEKGALVPVSPTASS